MDHNKQEIIDLFNNNVKGKEICLKEGHNKTHCGKEGHWLENQFGIKPNSNNEPDINGYEMKTGESSTTYIDKAPDVKYLNGVVIKNRDKKTKQELWRKYSSKKMSEDATIGGWSVKKYNDSGQKMIIDDHNNIQIVYDYDNDSRENKDSLGLDKTPHIIMQWNAASLKTSIERKFNQNGWYKCVKEGNVFTKICFGNPMTFDLWIEQVKKGVIYHDGYSKLKGRGRHVFRAANKFWDSLITEEY
jgi:hypothetical protein